MANMTNQKVRNLAAAASTDIPTDVVGSVAGSSYVMIDEHERIKIYRTKFKTTQDLVYTVSCAAGGQADGQGLKIGSFPEGAAAIMGAHVNFSLTTAAGLSATGAVLSVGTAAATANTATLTSTAADIVGSQTLGDGTIAAATAELTSLFCAASTNSINAVDGSAAAKDIYLNIAGTWTKASGATSTFTIPAGAYVTLIWAYMGDD